MEPKLYSQNIRNQGSNQSRSIERGRDIFKFILVHPPTRATSKGTVAFIDLHVYEFSKTFFIFP